MKNISQIIFFLCLGIQITITAQNKIEQFKSNPDSLLQIYKATNKLDSLHLLTRKSYIYFYKKKEFKKGIKYALIEKDLGRQFLGDKKYKRCLYNLGKFYFYTNSNNTSISYFKKVIDSFSIDRKTYQAYCEIGSNYNRLRDYYQSISYYEKGLSKPDILTKKSLYNQYYNYAIVLSNLETKQYLNKGLFVLKKASTLGDSIGISLSKKFNKNNLFAKFHSNDLLPNKNKATPYFQENLKIARFQKDTSNLLIAYNNYGGFLNKIKSDSALYHLKKGINLSSEKSSVLARLNLNLAEYYSIKNQPQEAIESIHDALNSFPNLSVSTEHNTVIKLEDALLANNKALLWNILTDKAKYYIQNYDSTKISAHAQLALENLIIADQLIDAIRFESFENQSKLVWQNYASETYMLGVKAASILDRNKDAFYFMEKNKAVLLLENISESQVKNLVSLPKNILEKEFEFEKKINVLENSLNNTNNPSDSLSKQYYNNKIEYKNFIESLKEDYPDYYNYKAPAKVMALNRIQESLTENDLVVEYILDETDGYILAISKNKSQLVYINQIDKLSIKIEDYLNRISKPFSKPEDEKSYNTIAKELYQVLLPFLENQAFQNIKNITIIPDYLLQNIPFESLKNSTDNYLLSTHEINYAYSMSFLKQNEGIKRNTTKTYIGFSPNTFADLDLSTLTNSESEITEANKQFSGSIYINELATKENFLAHSKDYKIIHLSTHANANDSIAPWIAFKNKKMYLNEIHTTKNQAELVILSACKTSLGAINKGEGVFSLARGFFYSGSNSVVSSLWNVNSKSTQGILSNFHHYLKKGETKSTSLRLAKLDYLNNHSHSELSPYYWSSLILIGNNDSISTSSSYLFYISIILILLILFFITKKKFAG